jgi:hypothetical protein
MTPRPRPQLCEPDSRAKLTTVAARPRQPEPEPEPDNLGAVVSGCAGFLVNGDLTSNRSAQSMEGD